MSGLNGHLSSTWTQFKATGCLLARNRLVEHYWPMVERCSAAVKIHEATLDREDLVQGTFFRLIKAMSTYDPGRGVKFETYARRAILQSMWHDCNRWSFGPLRPDMRPPAERSLKAFTDLREDQKREVEGQELRDEPLRNVAGQADRQEAV